MSKPTDVELKIALKTAIEMKESDNDAQHLAKALLNHHYRLGYLEKVLAAADRFMNLGMAEHDRTELLRAIEKAKESEDRTAKIDHEDFGLE